jgi:hypothetical protein
MPQMLARSLLRATAAPAAAARSGHMGVSACAAAVTPRRSYYGSGGPSPLHGHPLGHIAPSPMTPGSMMNMHATTILSVRKGGKVVR